MNRVKLLIEGYAEELNGYLKASCTTTLIQTSNKNIVVDPGINKKRLLESFKKNNLKITDIDYVFLTHYHPDHVFLAAIFEQSIIFDGDTIYKKDKEIPFHEKLPGTNIRVLLTPGHAHEHASLLVENENRKAIAIAGDVFWWMKNEKQETDYKSLITHYDPFTKDKDKLTRSRKLLLKSADWIIPEHGKMFKSPNNK